MWVARQRAASDSLSLVTSVPATATDPASGRSMPAIRFSNVVLPDPEGPIRPRNSPSGTSRSEEHTSELQSQSNLVCRLLLEKKKTNDQRRGGERGLRI